MKEVGRERGKKEEGDDKRLCSFVLFRKEVN
jgi:hypothetical protein